jgi:excisionase family DNA binding protein
MRTMALLTVKAAAARLGCSPALVYLLCAERKLAHVRLGTARGTIRVEEADLEAFLVGCKVEAHSLHEDLKHIHVGTSARHSRRADK